jgi:2,5-diketo-D-gluconate reductase A
VNGPRSHSGGTGAAADEGRGTAHLDHPETDHHVASSVTIPSISLANDVSMPQLGIGVDQVPPEETAGVVLQALDAGYRLIDTAPVYSNEMQVGQAIRESGVHRSDLFVTTKCSNDDHGYAAATRALKKSLTRLRMEHVDLYLIHWPMPAQDRYVETWQALVDAQRAGPARVIGVSNFQLAHLRRLVGETGVNQIEMHPDLQQPVLRRAHAEAGIVTQAWSPLAQGAALEDPTIVSIAQEHGRTAAQVVLRWHLTLGNVVVPESVTPRRIRENIDVFDFELSKEEVDRIRGVDEGRRIGPDPDRLVPNPPLSHWRRVRVSAGEQRQLLSARLRDR